MCVYVCMRERNRERERTKWKRDSKPTPLAVLPPAINNALAYKSTFYTCEVDHTCVCVYVWFPPRVPRCHCLFLVPVLSLSPANTLSLPRPGFPAFGRRIVMARVEARGELTAHGTKQDATMEHCTRGKDDTREREGEREESAKARKRESWR